MKGLIKFELINIFKSVSFIVCGIILAVLSCTSVLMTYLELQLLEAIDLSKEFLGFTCDGEHFMIFGPVNANFTLLIGIVVCIAVCTGYSQKTYRNILARGFSRGQLFAAKMIATSLVAAVYAFASMVISFLMATIMWGAGDEWEPMSIIVVLLELLMCVALSVAFTGMAFICKNMGLSIVIAVMCPSLLSLGSSILDLILEMKDIDVKTSQFVLTNMMQLMAATKPYDSEMVIKAGICMLAYVITGIVAGYFGMKKDEI